uniref:Tyr recombinase domain-containing protein n=1 Tax=Oedogonium capilliforme TaxID=2831087 RepID=A0A8E8P921_9CHLO|nr:hypothetical protein [Oedogonium capilliforme]QWE36192.1 hypothetical protein [Oedogonium capilliforme]
MVQTEIQKLAQLNQLQFLSISDQLNEQFQTIRLLIDKIDKKLNKKRNKHITLPLRDPIAFEIYQKLLNFPYADDRKLKLISYAQFRISAVLLYCTGSRINEIREFTYDDFVNAKKQQRIQTIQTKTHESRFCVLGQMALQQLDRIEDDIQFLFVQNNFKFLGASLRNPYKSMQSSAWIRSINKTLAEISKFFGISLILKSHSFRISYVTRTLKMSDIQKTADLIGHKSLNTTRRYNRYLLNTTQNRELVDQAFNTNIEE